MVGIDVEPTAEHIDQMARELRRYASSLERYAHLMREKKDITYASEVINEIVGLFNNFRLDLLVTRPIKAVRREKR